MTYTTRRRYLGELEYNVKASPNNTFRNFIDYLVQTSRDYPIKKNYRSISANYIDPKLY